MIKKKQIISSLWILGIATYLAVSFIFGIWTYSWAIFPVVFVLTIALEVGFNKGNYDSVLSIIFRRENASNLVWVLAVVIFLCLGFVWNSWHPGWVVFLLAAIPSILMGD